MTELYPKKVKVSYPELREMFKDESHLIGGIKNSMIECTIEPTDSDIKEYLWSDDFKSLGEFLRFKYKDESIKRLSAKIERKINKARDENIKEMLSIANSIGVMYGN